MASTKHKPTSSDFSKAKSVYAKTATSTTLPVYVDGKSYPTPIPVNNDKAYDCFTTWMMEAIPIAKEVLENPLARKEYLKIWKKSRKEYRPDPIKKLFDDAGKELHLGDVIAYTWGSTTILRYGIVAGFSKIGIPFVHRSYSDIGTNKYYSIRRRKGFIKVDVNPERIKFSIITTIMSTL